MIGVVVWSNCDHEQAVIWCDDHGALAYLVGRDDFPAGFRWPVAGNMVELRTEVRGDLRCARDVRPLSDSVAMEVPRALGHPAAGDRSRLTVVPDDGKSGPPKPLSADEAMVLEMPPRRVAAG